MSDSADVTNEVLRGEILTAAIGAFNAAGARFTLNDVCRPLRISKKTIYTVFPGKEALLCAMIDEGFRRVKEEEELIYLDGTMSTAEKIRRIVIVIPESFRRLDFRKFASLRDGYPAVYAQIVQHLETGWDRTLELFEKGMREGTLRRFPLPLVKAMIESSMEAFLLGKYPDDIEYEQALDLMMEIFMKGLLAREDMA
ncbi:MAG TPA: TetR/AcrR family transcriptional regulator [Treponemataceae bacterium]|jgi:AcrR family transcriptional regulator|nr:TetR/AcrR family transcriptional regulator [Treponema sp.]OQB03481.1 MAG: regulatory protein [Spirochaetes bacterium ADurb.Bin215]HOF85565.1 TetR/AcrR family transcriptional regulator [Treponemataceae bacterium]HOS35800.1 TetR/AcrR family transcriptional regulator [Treponemataceae bacterium]HOU39188.1 TetR/AcrR family transcriptional regulator [Treponemataceae bacterium]